MKYYINAIYSFKKEAVQDEVYHFVSKEGDYKPFNNPVSVSSDNHLKPRLNEPKYVLKHNINRYFGKMFLKNPERHIYAGNCLFKREDLCVYFFKEDLSELNIVILNNQYKRVKFDNLVYDEGFLTEVSNRISNLKK